MTRVTASLSVSLDGFSSGSDQSEERPFGTGIDDGEDLGDRLHRWMFEAGEDHEVEIAANLAPDAFIMGRNMFGPVRGDWGDSDWRGWWGPEPTFHSPVFVLTHHAREKLIMDGGTTFSFVTDGIEAALAQAAEVVGRDGLVGVSGGASTVRQYLAADLVDELRLQIVPMVVGAGDRFTDGLDHSYLGPIAVRHHPLATHITYRRRLPAMSERVGSVSQPQRS
jgi:dihydrofolate reductase